jgi:RNA recognition motif-containing protein
LLKPHSPKGAIDLDSEKRIALKKLYVGNLPFQVNSSDLEQLFSQFGEDLAALSLLASQPHPIAGGQLGAETGREDFGRIGSSPPWPGDWRRCFMQELGPHPRPSWSRSDLPAGRRPGPAPWVEIATIERGRPRDAQRRKKLHAKGH